MVACFHSQERAFVVTGCANWTPQEVEIWKCKLTIFVPYLNTLAAAANSTDRPHWSLRSSRARLPRVNSCFTHVKFPPHTAQWRAERPHLSHRVTSAWCLRSAWTTATRPRTQAHMRAVTPVGSCGWSTVAHPCM